MKSRILNAFSVMLDNQTHLKGDTKDAILVRIRTILSDDTFGLYASEGVAIRAVFLELDAYTIETIFNR